jgi:hypothetical protein
MVLMSLAEYGRQSPKTNAGGSFSLEKPTAPPLAVIIGEALLRSQRTDTNDIVVPHTDRNDILIKNGEVLYQGSGITVQQLLGYRESQRILRQRGQEPTDMDFRFFTTNGAFYDEMELKGLHDFPHGGSSIKHIALFESVSEEFAIRIDDIYILTSSVSALRSQPS